MHITHNRAGKNVRGILEQSEGTGCTRFILEKRRISCNVWSTKQLRTYVMCDQSCKVFE